MPCTQPCTCFPRLPSGPAPPAPRQHRQQWCPSPRPQTMSYAHRDHSSTVVRNHSTVVTHNNDNEDKCSDGNGGTEGVRYACVRWRWCAVGWEDRGATKRRVTTCITHDSAQTAKLLRSCAGPGDNVVTFGRNPNHWRQHDDDVTTSRLECTIIAQAVRFKLNIRVVARRCSADRLAVRRRPRTTAPLVSCRLRGGTRSCTGSSDSGGAEDGWDCEGAILPDLDLL